MSSDHLSQSSAGQDHSALDTHRSEAVRLLKALANEHRLTILCCLRDGEVSVGELSRRLPLSQSALSQHLAWLRAEHLVLTRRHAQTIYYQLCDDKADRIIRVLNTLYCGLPAAGTEHAPD